MTDPWAIAAGALAMAAILLTWLMAGGAILGLGAAARRLAGARTFHADDLLASYAAGLAVALGLLQVWHLLLPVNAAAAVALLLAGWAGLFRAAPALRAFAGDARPRAALPLTLLALAALWLSNRALAAPTGSDAGLYHLQSVRWIHTFPIVPGLANLHGRFGFNNANHLLAAALGSGPWHHLGSHLATPLFVLPLAAAGILGLVRACRANPRPADFFDAVLLGPAFLMAVHPDFASPSSDLPAACLTLLSASLLFKVLAAAPLPAAAPAATLCLTLVLAAAACVKLSAAVWALPAGLLAAAALALRLRDNRPALRLALAAGALAVSLLLGPWIARSVVLSGYPFFPLSSPELGLSWQTPRERVDYERLSVISWARQPGKEIAPTRDGSWARVRLRELTYADPFAALYPVLFGAAALALALVLDRAPGRPSPAARAPRQAALALALLWTIATLGWFFSAPALRFAWHLFFIPPALGLAGLAAATLHRPRAAGLLLLALGAGLILRVHDPLLFRPPLVIPDPARGLLPPPAPHTFEFTTRTGLVVHIPAQGGDCWNSPLPCAPYPNANLALRRGDDLAGGFVLLPADDEPNVLAAPSEAPSTAPSTAPSASPPPAPKPTPP